MAIDVFTHILREASAGLLVQLYRAIPEPQDVGRATSAALTLFLLTTIFFVSQKILEKYGDKAKIN